MADIPRPTVTEVGDSYRFTWDTVPIVIELSGLEDTRGGLTGEIMIANAISPDIIYESGSLNLSAMQTRTTLGNNLKRDVDDLIEWTAMLKQVCLIATRRHRQGEPSIDLREYQLGDGPRWYLEPYLENEGFTIMYADGGSGKSVLALAMAYGMTTGQTIVGTMRGASLPTLYLDWETGAATQYRRLRALAAAHNAGVPGVIYRHMTTPLIYAAPQVRTEIATRTIGSIIIDSLGASANGPIEDSATALALGRAIRTFRVPVLAIHHKPKNVDGRRGAQVMFGSVYFANYCRIAWEMTAVTDEGRLRTEVQLVNTKNNAGPKEPRHAFAITFQNDTQRNPIRIDVARRDVRDVPEFAATRPLWQQVADVLLGSKRPMTPKEIADELDANSSSVRSALKRMGGQGKALKMANDRWGMMAEEAPF